MMTTTTTAARLGRGMAVHELVDGEIRCRLDARRAPDAGSSPVNGARLVVHPTIEQVDCGLCLRAAAARTAPDVTPGSVAEAAQEHARAQALADEWAAERDRRICRDVAAGRAQRAVARAAGMAHSSVQKCLRRAGLD